MAPGLEQELGCLLRALGLPSPSIRLVFLAGRADPSERQARGLRSDSRPRSGRPLRTGETDEDRLGQAACPALLP